ncbi:cytidine and dCMP deaminase domain-containing protein 1-like [Ptychodera flava]|uniref:cytidine and dCMP deaminase domain-containing protein 1-like n=1 Tax=Ptychodera flava TaxID=63121 RepID=UPI00396A4A14
MATEGRPALDDTAMFMAMWMHQHPLAEDPERAVEENEIPKPYNKMGVVVKNADGYLFAAEFSRKYAHPVMSLVLKFGRRLAGSTLYASRKPCSDCTKHMLQVIIKHVYYFPCDPEAGNPTNSKTVEDLEISDHLFKVSDMSVRVKIPSYIKPIIPEDSTPLDNLGPFGELCVGPNSEYVVSRQALRCAISAKEEEKQTVTDEMFKERMKGKYRTAIMKLNAMADQYPSGIPPEAIPKEASLNFTEENRETLCRHGFVMANITSYRSSDLKTGVGAALMNSEGHYIGFGYSGFPWGISIDDVPRYGGKTEASASYVKYPYVIHAETNALTFCNKIGINHKDEKTVLFSSEEPCNHCAFNIFESGVKMVVYGKRRKNEDGKKTSSKISSGTISYEKLTEYAERNGVSLFIIETQEDGEPLERNDVLE